MRGDGLCSPFGGNENALPLPPREGRRQGRRRRASEQERNESARAEKREKILVRRSLFSFFFFQKSRPTACVCVRARVHLPSPLPFSSLLFSPPLKSKDTSSKGRDRGKRGSNRRERREEKQRPKNRLQALRRREAGSLEREGERERAPGRASAPHHAHDRGPEEEERKKERGWSREQPHRSRPGMQPLFLPFKVLDSISKTQISPPSPTSSGSLPLSIARREINGDPGG